VLVAAAVVGAGAVMGPQGPPMRPERIVEFAAAQTADALHDPARLDAILRRAHEAFGIERAVFDGAAGGRQRRAAPPPLPDAELARLAAGVAFRIPGAAGLRGAAAGHPGAYAVLAAAGAPTSCSALALVIGAVLLALAIASVRWRGGSPLPSSGSPSRSAARRGNLAARAGSAGRRGRRPGRAFDEWPGAGAAGPRRARAAGHVSHELRTPRRHPRALELAAGATRPGPAATSRRSAPT